VGSGVLEKAGIVSSSDIRRKLGMDMLKGDHYDLSEQRCTVKTTTKDDTFTGEAVLKPGETRFGYTNEFACKVKVTVRNGKVQVWEFVL
jgi:hypothetical protein